MGKFSKIKMELEKLLYTFSNLSTDKGVINWGSDNDLPEAGEAITITDENGNVIAAPDGEYKADNIIIKVADGKVAEIVDSNDIQIPEEEPKNEEKPNEEEKPVEEPKEEEQPNEPQEEDKPAEEPKNEEEQPIEEQPAPEEEQKPEEIAPEEVQPEENPDTVEEIVEDVNEVIVDDNPITPEDPNDKKAEYLQELINQLGIRIKVLEDKIAKLESTPAAEPAAQAFSKVNKIENTGNSKLDNLARILNAK